MLERAVRAVFRPGLRKRCGPNTVAAAFVVRSAERDTPAPCFFWKKCRRMSEVEKQGKGVCRECPVAIKGREHPLRTARQHRYSR